jgi:hypothetical protein
MAERIGDEIILERMYAAEQILLTQADALDMKASYLLIVLVFLAQLSTTFIARHDLSWFFRISQWLSCVLMFSSSVLLLLELRIRRFKSEGVFELEALRDRITAESKERDDYKDAAHPNEYVRGRLVWSLIQGSKNRIHKNDLTNAKKVSHLQWAYGLAALAFLLDILFMILFSDFTKVSRRRSFGRII